MNPHQFNFGDDFRGGGQPLQYLKAAYSSHLTSPYALDLDRLGQPSTTSDQEGGNYSSIDNRQHLQAYNQLASSSAVSERLRE